jgi:Protein of unknown function (DUF4232)
MTPVTRRTLGMTLVLSTALLAAACSSSSTTGTSEASAPSSTPAASSAPATTPASSQPAPQPSSTGSAGVTGCATSGLKVKVDTAQGGAAAGSTYVPIDFTNTTGSTCTMFGYPGVSFVTGAPGSQLGRPAKRNPADQATTVMLAPGAVAHATLQVAEAGNYDPSACKPVTAHWLRVYPPNQFSPVYAKYTVQVCSAKLPHGLGSQLGIYVVRPGAGKSGQP